MFSVWKRDSSASANAAHWHDYSLKWLVAFAHCDSVVSLEREIETDIVPSRKPHYTIHYLCFPALSLFFTFYEFKKKILLFTFYTQKTHFLSKLKLFSLSRLTWNNLSHPFVLVSRLFVLLMQMSPWQQVKQEITDTLWFGSVNYFGCACKLYVLVKVIGCGCLVEGRYVRKFPFYVATPSNNDI